MRYASMAGSAAGVRSAAAAGSASMAGSAGIARTATAVEPASMAGSAEKKNQEDWASLHLLWFDLFAHLRKRAAQKQMCRAGKLRRKKMVENMARGAALVVHRFWRDAGGARLMVRSCWSDAGGLALVMRR